MVTEPLLAVDDLLAPIPGDNPAGESVSFDVRSQLEEARKEVNPDDFAADDPYRPTDAVRADWKGLVRLASKTLTAESKDLLIAARLTEALTKLHGHAGLADGFRLMRRLVTDCWDRLHPLIEDGDVEVRAGPFNWIGDDGRGARFPHSLRTIGLFPADPRPFTFQDWRDVQDNKGTVNREALDKAINAASREHCQTLVDDVSGALTEFNGLIAALNQHLGPAAPGMTDLRKVLDETLALARQLLQRKGGPITAEGAAADGADGGTDATGSAVNGARTMLTRDDVYHRLSEAADQLQKMEPHSPIPFLIRRAVALGALPFPLLMKALMREEFHQGLVEMNRELGITEESGA